MSHPQETQLVSVERVENLIHLARGEKVLLDADLARLYGVETKALNRAVKRNQSRFPQDFMFQVTAEEAGNLKCQIGTSSSRYGGRRYLPYAFRFVVRDIAERSSKTRTFRFRDPLKKPPSVFPLRLDCATITDLSPLLRTAR